MYWVEVVVKKREVGSILTSEERREPCGIGKYEGTMCCICCTEKEYCVVS